MRYAMHMDPATLSTLPAVIGSDRFGTYLTAAGGDPARAIRLYTWNIEVSAAFWGELQVVEVALRNALHEQMQILFRRPDWWNHPAVDLHHDQREQVAKAEAKLTRRRTGFGTGHVVAELSFGFWTGLLGRGRSYEHRLWVPALRHALPTYRGSRSDLHRSVESIRLFRNRIAHHEPIFARHLAADHASIVALAGYLGEDLRTWITELSRVPEALSRRTGVVDGALPSGF